MKLCYESEYDKFMESCKIYGVVLFGASKMGEQVSNELIKKGIKIKYFCDNDENKYGKKINDTYVISLDELKVKNKDINIMITTCFFEEVYGQLMDLGFKNVMYRPGLEYNPFYDKEIIKNNINDIEKVYNLLEDEKSREAMLGIINHRLTNTFNCIKYSKNQYFDVDIIKMDEEEIFLDGGAYIGDTLEEFIKLTNDKFKKVYEFEPDKGNAQIIQRNFENYVHENKVIVEEKGLLDEFKRIGFMSCNDSISRINEDGTDFIETVSIDEYLNDEPVTFIKMDIEGSELLALKGAIKTIKKYKPKLAICIYHKPEDLWEIPLFIKKILPEYRIYIRHHSKYLFETVCYAII